VTNANSNKPNHGQPGAPPTDMELMLYVDGELDEARHQQVEAYLLLDLGSRAKVAGLDLSADVVRESAQSFRLADGIADAVMAKIEAGHEGGASGRHGAAVRPVTASVLPKVRALGKQPANDNSRGIFALAALAVAAAAAMMIWGRVEAEPPSATLTAPKPAEAAAPPPSSEVAPTAVQGAEGEAGPGVEVAAVDFGARMGTVFYVPQGSAASSPTTTVVWLADNGPGGE
jgi:hypothetical protein